MSEYSNTAKPLTVETLKEALTELQRQCDAKGLPVMLAPGPVYIRPASISEKEFTQRIFDTIAGNNPDGRTS